MRTYEELVGEAGAADVTGWGFGWLEGRATEERPPWGYVRILTERLPTATSALDLDTGGGEVLGEALAAAGSLPPRLAATEGWAPNAAVARRALARFGVDVLDAAPGEPLPVPDASVDLLTSRHPVRPAWEEVARVLVDGGTYLAQHVGPASAFELVEAFLGPQLEARRGRDPHAEAAAADAAGLDVVELRTAICRMEFHDIGAVVWTLRKCVWWVPDFSVERYEDVLRGIDAQLRRGEPFVAHSTRTLFDARRRPR
ncbi:methyltransferase domain-containing protein [Intrasporangium sp. YIM S08009]|uniref:methyltransferase domain-containing protein n=1 Tax=Intrasporangium zincisolvens TaxID=3080018 RepID=UPI002B061CE0|nr:methyltransferase domain-containing protein [Intrasporangium sp. YIM S08009]